MNNKTAGFTYAEVVMALAVLCILLIPVLPALSQASRNNENAQARYRAQLFADELATAAVRGISTTIPPELDALAYTYVCWVSGGGTGTAAVYLSNGAPDAEDAFSIDGDTAAAFTVAVAVVWDSSGNPAGRAVRLMP